MNRHQVALDKSRRVCRFLEADVAGGCLGHAKFGLVGQNLAASRFNAEVLELDGHYDDNLYNGR